jgi:hypothetical protein
MKIAIFLGCSPLEVSDPFYRRENPYFVHTHDFIFSVKQTSNGKLPNTDDDDDNNNNQ